MIALADQRGGGIDPQSYPGEPLLERSQPTNKRGDIMIVRNPYQVEIAGRFATMYLAGRVMRAERDTLVQACGALPAAVQVLCVSLDDLDQLADGGLVVIHGLRRNWQSTRRGSFRLAFARGDSGRPVIGAVLLAG